MTCLHLMPLIELDAAGSYLAVRPSLYVSRMHHWVMLKEVKAVLEHVVRDYEESLVSVPWYQHIRTSHSSLTDSVFGFTRHLSSSIHSS